MSQPDQDKNNPCFKKKNNNVFIVSEICCSLIKYTACKSTLLVSHVFGLLSMMIDNVVDF